MSTTTKVRRTKACAAGRHYNCLGVVDRDSRRVIDMRPVGDCECLCHSDEYFVCVICGDPVMAQDAVRDVEGPACRKHYTAGELYAAVTTEATEALDRLTQAVADGATAPEGEE